jgi:hypothetical protein
MLTPGPPHQPQPADALEGANARRAMARHAAKQAKPFFIGQFLPLNVKDFNAKNECRVEEFLSERCPSRPLVSQDDGGKSAAEGLLWVKSGLSLQHRSMTALPPKADISGAWGGRKDLGGRDSDLENKGRGTGGGFSPRED